VDGRSQSMTLCDGFHYLSFLDLRVVLMLEAFS
jgi:hypothetical protein